MDLDSSPTWAEWPRDRETAQRPRGGIVRDADPAIVEEAGERGPALEQRSAGVIGRLPIGGHAPDLAVS
jgi:hypothetical protein